MLRKESDNVLSFLNTIQHPGGDGNRETLDGFQSELQIGGRIVTNLRYADNVIVLATSEAELQELMQLCNVRQPPGRELTLNC